MRLQQFLSTVFPRLSKTKSERNGQNNNSADQKAVEQRTDSNSHLQLSDLKYAFDAVDPAAHVKGSLGFREGTTRNECDQSVRGGGGVVGETEDEMHWVSEQFEDSRTGAAVSRSRSMIRTNPWLASPKSQHNESVQSEETAGPLSLLHKSLPTTPTTSLAAGKGTMDYRQALHARRDLGLLLKVPGNLDDSSSEGYSSSVFRSPSGTDLDSIEGCPDSALASSISSESDFDWGASLVPSHSSLFHATRTAPGYGKVGLEHRAAVVISKNETQTEDHHMETTKDSKEELYSKRIQHTAGVSIQHKKEALVVEAKSIGIRVPPEHPRELKLVKCYNNSEHSSPEPVLRSSYRNQCESPSHLKRVQQTDAPRPLISTQSHENNTTAAEGVSEEAKEVDEKTALQKLTGAVESSGSSRSLNEISESLQDKVRRLHEQKQYVDAIFHRAREADQQRESQFAKFRSQFVAAKRQALLRKLQELQTMLGKQSTKLQVVYDAVLHVQWPKVFNVCDARPTN